MPRPREHNDALTNALRGTFQDRYEPNFAWKSACATFLALPGLRGFWPMSSFNGVGAANDLSGQGRTLTNNNTVFYNYTGLRPFATFIGTNEHLSRADEAGLDIIGSETYVNAAARGLTMGGWFWRDVQKSQGFMSKGGGAASAYGIYNTGPVDNIRFEIVDALGANQGFTWVDGSNGVLQWEFVVLRFDPTNNAVDGFINNETNTVATPGGTTIRNSAEDFYIGRYGASYLDGRASMCFLCAMALSDTIILSLFEQTRAMFGI